jgi:hypothetical protein
MFDKHVEHHADPLKASKIMMDKLKCKNTNFDSKKNNKKTINDDSNSYFKNN